MIKVISHQIFRILKEENQKRNQMKAPKYQIRMEITSPRTNAWRKLIFKILSDHLTISANRSH